MSVLSLSANIFNYCSWQGWNALTAYSALLVLYRLNRQRGYTGALIFRTCPQHAHIPNVCVLTSRMGRLSNGDTDPPLAKFGMS